MDGDFATRPAPPALEEALHAAHLPSLIMTLIHLTGDTHWLGGERPVYMPFGDGQGDLSAAFQREVRTAALGAVSAYRNGRPLAAPPSPDTVRKMMDFIVGDTIPPHYAPFLMEELALDGVDSNRPQWDAPQLKAAAVKIKVLIIGAGMSGLLTAIRLQQAGIDFEIIEKNQDVGGTWLENTYPGCRVDTPNHLYSFSFEPNHDWPARYSTQDVLLAYFQRTADKHQLRSKIRFGTTVEKTVFDEVKNVWKTTIKDKSGDLEVLETTAVVSAVGQLNQPRMPEIEGMASFKGRSFHSAAWPRDFDPKGLNIAVVGTGASAFQFVPKIAPEAKSLTVFQRTPPWLAPTADYHDLVPEGKKSLLEHLPFYDRWYRFYLFWTMTDGVYEAIKADPDWAGGPEAVGAANAMLRQMLVEVIRPQTEGRSDLFDKVIPTYPFGGKRALRDNGVWIKALRRDNVELVTSRIAKVDPDGVVDAAGVTHAVDAIIYGTGFYASSFLRGIEVVGRGGVKLHDRWNGDARAYLGIAVPGFPNFFTLYGPNTNIVVNGSIIFFSECAVRYILGCLKLMARTGSASVEVEAAVHDAFNAKVDAANAKMAWGAAQVSSWYKNETGRVSQNWPFPLVDYWSATREPDPGEFILTSPGAAKLGA